MRVAVFSTKPYDRLYLDQANDGYQHDLVYLESRLNVETVALAAGFKAVCVFVNDHASGEVLQSLAAMGVELLALRCAGFNNVDLKAADEYGITVMRVPAYSPHAVAEYTVSLMLSLNRRIHRAYNRVRDGNFTLHGMLGFDMYGRTVGLIGTGRIGYETARILRGFGCRVVAYDVVENPACEALGVEYLSLPFLLAQSDIVSLHCPLNPQTYHLINRDTLAQMKDGVMIINTCRGGVLDTQAVIDALKSGKVGYLGLDVYEQEGDLFFEDLSNRVIKDDTFERLLTFPNVLVTGHQGYFTADALQQIADTTLQNIYRHENDIAGGFYVDRQYLATGS